MDASDNRNNTDNQDNRYICYDCPRKCGAVRTPHGGSGFCGSGSVISLVRAAPHFGEEPCVSGSKGSGAVFFTGCNLRCVFCQNYEISRPVKDWDFGDSTSTAKVCGPESGSITARREVTVPEFREILLRLRDTGVHNINLVTPTHFTRKIAEALAGLNLGIPIVWNSSGYEKVESLRMLEGLVQIYMPDYKYADAALAKKYSAAPDYPRVATEAIREMYRQTAPYRMDNNGILESGVLIRHMILPGNNENSMDTVDFVADTFPQGSVLFSIMSQYTPIPAAIGAQNRFEELRGRVTAESVELVMHYMKTRRLEDGYWQEPSSATGEMIPLWDGTGISFPPR